jgi:hypothetical protein
VPTKEVKTEAESTTYAPPVKQEPVHRTVVPVVREDEPRRILPWTTIAAAVILAIFIGWHFLHKSPAPIPTLATMPSQPASTTAAENQPTPSVSAASPAPSQTAVPATGPRTQWRVVAYTYNHQDQAQDKVAQILSKHAALNPEVFAPKGHAPYLVTVGGAMSHDEAMTFRRKARSEGLPRDTYAQNFPANDR